MGRFESTVPFYAPYREPYPPGFFSTVAERLPLHGTERLLDVGCGPAMLAIGFAPFVAACTGIDPEPGMIAVAKDAAKEAGVGLDLIEGRVEDLPESTAPFEVVAIGRAQHWLDRATALRVLERIVAPAGAILVCGTRYGDDPVNAWTRPYDAVRRAWSSDPDERRYHIDLKAWFAGSRFEVTGSITASVRRRTTISGLIGRALSRSTTSPAVLGERRGAFERALAEAVLPYSSDGAVEEEIVAVATVVR